jgi:hypothetical protein
VANENIQYANIPSNREPLNDMHETAKAQRDIKDKVAVIVNLLEKFPKQMPRQDSPE